MFSDSSSERRGVYENSSEGLWALHVSTQQFWAWKYWLTDSLGYKPAVHGNWLTVWQQWPPRTAAEANRVAQCISDLRDELRIGSAVPRRPSPWDGVAPIIPAEYRNMAIR